MNHPVTKIVFAKALRKQQTDAEKKLWRYLRNRQLQGIKFRRQEPVGLYIVDFLSIESKLVIELDGGQHNEDKVRYNDTKRTKYLEAQGYNVLRFWDNDVLNKIDIILEQIALTLSLSQRERV